jgi:predicted metal-dependent peptidase
LYLPGVTKENLGTIAIAVDTSGSISQKVLAAFCTEINAIAHECRPEAIRVLYCDTRVNREEEYTADDEITLTAPGRGGTAFQPVFDAIAQWDTPPCCLVYLTDLDSSDIPTEPEYPTLWAADFAYLGGDRAPFGTLIQLRTEEK